MKKKLYCALALAVFTTGVASPAIATAPQSEVIAHAKATAVTLGSGSYKVGDEIKPGRYVITAQSGSGNLSGSNGLNVILGDSADDDLGQITSYTMDLKKNAKVKIDGIEAVDFKPVAKRSYSTNLSAGQWVVGKDIKPGRYVIKAVQGNGNLSTKDGEVNEIMGVTSDDDLGQVTKTTQTLHRGQVLESDLQQISLTKK